MCVARAGHIPCVSQGAVCGAALLNPPHAHGRFGLTPRLGPPAAQQTPAGRPLAAHVLLHQHARHGVVEKEGGHVGWDGCVSQ
jgi:hypothetical protein